MTRILPYSEPTKPMALVGRHHEVLRMRALPIDLNDASMLSRTKQLAGRMHATLQRHDGLAIAAPQVGIGVRLIVTNQGVAYVNPIVDAVPTHDGIETAIEGCLTYPGRMYAVPRARTIKLAAQLLDLQWFRDEHTDLAARMWQHEVDHLDGIIIADHWPETNARQTPLPTGAAERLGLNSVPGGSAGPLA